jgi:hypothetical protein
VSCTNLPANSNAITTYSNCDVTSNAPNFHCVNGATIVGCTTLSTFYADTDGDGFGDPNNSTTACSAPTGFVAISSDDCPQIFGLMFDACNDGNEYTSGDILNENCECIGPEVIPTLSQWGLIILGLWLSIFGIVAVRNKAKTLRKVQD